MGKRRINKFLSFFILFALCITGIYQTYDLADSYFVCRNESDAAIFQGSLVDSTQDIYFEDSSAARSFVYNRKEQDSADVYMVDAAYNPADIFDSSFIDDSGSCFSNILQENCIDHFSNTVITNYVHLKDGQKIA